MHQNLYTKNRARIMLFNTAVINLIYLIYYYLVTNNKKDSVGLLYEISSNTIHNFIFIKKFDISDDNKQFSKLK